MTRVAAEASGRHLSLWKPLKKHTEGEGEGAPHLRRHETSRVADVCPEIEPSRKDETAENHFCPRHTPLYKEKPESKRGEGMPSIKFSPAKEDEDD